MCVTLQEEMAAANVDMVWRDFCAHVLIKLNDCRCVGGGRGTEHEVNLLQRVLVCLGGWLWHKDRTLRML